MRSEQILKEIKKIFDQTTSILITGQANPDGDSLGSQLSLYDILIQQKQHIAPSESWDIVVSNDSMPPERYYFFPHIDVVTPFEKIQDRQFDVGFVLDSHIERVGKVSSVLQKCQYKIAIDHHQNRIYGDEDISWVDPKTSSVAEMVYDFIEHPEWNVTLNADIATCLYTGIIYDTGNFFYPCTTSRSHQIVAELFETGIDFAGISSRIFLEESFSGFQLLSEVLQNLQRDKSGEIIWGTITQEMLKRLHVKLEEIGEIISRYTFIKGIKIAVLFKEISQNEVKISFRSRGAIDVGHFAQRISSQGGGHQRSAGCSLNGTIKNVQKSVIRSLQEELRGNS